MVWHDYVFIDMHSGDVVCGQDIFLHDPARGGKTYIRAAEGVGPYGDVRKNALPVLGAEGNKIGTGAAVIVLLQPQPFPFR